MKQFLITTASIAVLVFSVATSAAAQEVEEAVEPAPTAAPVNPMLAAATLQTALAVKEQERIQAKLAAAKAKMEYAALGLPSSDIKGVDGSVTVANAGGYFADILAYDALNAASNDVICAVKAKLASDSADKTIILVDTMDFGAVAQLHTLLETRFTMMKASLEAVKANENLKVYSVPPGTIEDNPFVGELESVAAVISAIPAALGLARGISQFFQTEVTVSGRTLTADKKTLHANLAKHIILSEKTCTVGRSFGLIASLPGSGLSANKGQFVSYTALNVARNEVAKIKADIELNASNATKHYMSEKKKHENSIAKKTVELKAEVDVSEQIRLKAEIKTEEINLARAVDFISKVEAEKLPLISSIDIVLNDVDAFLKALVTENDTGTTPLQTVAIIDELKSGTNKYLLFADIASIGSELQLTKKSWSGTIGYLGGTVITYMLTDKHGVLKDAGQYKAVRAERFKRGMNVEDLRTESQSGHTCVKTPTEKCGT